MFLFGIDLVFLSIEVWVNISGWVGIYFQRDIRRLKGNRFYLFFLWLEVVVKFSDSDREVQ